MINLESPRTGAFREDDQRLMETLATQAVIALQEARLLEALEEVTVRMVRWPLDKLLEFIIQQACDLINAPHGVVWVLSSADPETLVVRAATAGHTPGETLPLAGSMTGDSMRERRPLISPDVGRDPRFLRHDLARRMGWVSGLIVPLLMRDGTPRGALTLYTAEPRTFSEWDQRLLTWLANHTAIAVQDAEALDQLAQARERQTLAETFAALGDVSANLLHRVNNLVGIIPVRVEGDPGKTAGPRRGCLPFRGAGGDRRQRARGDVRRAGGHGLPAAGQTPAHIGRDLLSHRARAARPSGGDPIVGGGTGFPPAGDGRRRAAAAGVLQPDGKRGRRAGRDGSVRRIRPPVIRIAGHAACRPARRVGPTGGNPVFGQRPGVPADRRENIFDLAFSTKRSPRKLGFGLWWVKTLITRLGGEIRLVGLRERSARFRSACPRRTGG